MGNRLTRDPASRRPNRTHLAAHAPSGLSLSQIDDSHEGLSST